MINSILGRFGKSDFVKGLALLIIQTVTGALVAMTYNFIKTEGVLPTALQWKLLAGSLVLTALSYIQKSLATNSQGKLFKRERK